MLKEHRLQLTTFFFNVQAYRETLKKAKEATKSGNHSKARDLHNDAQGIGEAIDGMMATIKEILKGADQITLFR